MNNAFSCPGSIRQNQRGASLIVAMIALLVMTISGLALVRSVDTTNVISGNLAFRQSTLSATDVGVETALSTLGTVISTSIDANYPAGCATGACTYYPTRQPTDSTGIPTVITWATVPKTTVDASYSVQYVIDRLCDGPTPVTDVLTKCMRTTGNLLVGSKKAGTVSFAAANRVYYRTTVRVVGPRNTVSIVQTLYVR